MGDGYHHGNLKNDLVENAIIIISEFGIDHLSLRSLSKKCGVSHNAIYRHFESKEKMIDYCREYVTNRLMEYLEKNIEGADFNNPDTINRLSYAYIDFFKERPTYYSFIYNSKTFCKIVFSLDEIEGNYPPFELFRKICIALIGRYNLTREEGLKRIVKYWALMHGAISLMISPNVKLDGEWSEYLKDVF